MFGLGGGGCVAAVFCVSFYHTVAAHGEGSMIQWMCEQCSVEVDTADKTVPEQCYQGFGLKSKPKSRDIETVSMNS